MKLRGQQDGVLAGKHDLSSVLKDTRGGREPVPARLFSDLHMCVLWHMHEHIHTAVKTKIKKYKKEKKMNRTGDYCTK